MSKEKLFMSHYLSFTIKKYESYAPHELHSKGNAFIRLTLEVKYGK